MITILISIIIPVYNTKEYLEKCVDSVIDRDLADYEVILVDDGSTDNESGPLCDKIAEKYPTYVRVIHQENMGLGGARNTGIENADGEYLIFLDSDDTLVQGAVSLLKNEIERCYPDIISFELRTDDGKGNGTVVSSNYKNFDMPFTLEEHPEYLLSLPNACGRVWKKSLFTNNGITFPSRVWYEDIRTTTKLFALAKGIVTLNKDLYIYLQREESIMHSSKLERNREIIDAFEDLLSWYKQNGLFESYKKELCRLCIDHLYIAASVRVLKSDVKHPLLKELRSYTEKEFPDFAENPYISEIPTMRKLAFLLLRLKQYSVLRLLFRMK